MNEHTTVVDTHLAAYGEPDATRRADLLARAWAPDGRLVDPPLVGEGRQGISDMVDAVLSQFPAHTFRRSTQVDGHHDAVRYGWELVGPDGAVVLAGTDVGEVDGDGRLVRVTGFFGELAPVA